MPNGEHAGIEPETDPDADAASATGPVFSVYGIGSTILALVAVVAVVLGALIWSGHRDHARELDYKTRAMQAAADWTGVLINMSKDNIDVSLQKLHDGTVGELNADFEAAVTPYRDVVQTLQSSTKGRIEAVAYESVHHDLDTTPGSEPPPPTALPAEMAKRTDSVLVVASSVSENVGSKPQTVRWNLRLGVSEVDGKLLISRLESMR